jgi:hypothetical protein
MNRSKSSSFSPDAHAGKLAVFIVVCAMLMALGAPPARSADLVLIGGEGDQVEVVAAALRTREWKTWTSSERWIFSLAPEWQIGFWNAKKSGIGERQIVDSNATGVLTIRPRESGYLPYYVDIGFGVHLLSHSRISDERNFGSSFQFGEFLGVGADFGERRRYAVAARIQHVSNGGIRRPNPGVTFVQISMMYRF